MASEPSAALISMSLMNAYGGTDVTTGLTVGYVTPVPVPGRTVLAVVKPMRAATV